MSLSKLESLPNEILSDIIEKYINGVDILTNFNYQLNRRFDALITQSYRLHFNFIQCRTDEFRFCMGLLSAYIEKIESLAISEQDAPGQVYAFLSFFPTFTPFKRLRKLYIHFDGKTVDTKLIKRALLSLLDTPIDSLSIQLENTADTDLLSTIGRDIFCLNTLRRFCLVGDLSDLNLDPFWSISSNIEYLIIPNIYCSLSDLRSIFQWAPHLKYLHIAISNTKYSVLNNSESNAKVNTFAMAALRTLILSFSYGDVVTLDILEPYLNAMPVLNRLEIEGSNKLVNADAWEMLLKRTLPLLKHFTLRITTSRLQRVSISDVQESFQNLFWISKKNFNLIITSEESSDVNNYERFIRQRRSWTDFDRSILQCWIAPNRTVDNDFSLMDEITGLVLSFTSVIEQCHYYFNNVKCLTVDDMNKSLLRWMTTYVNYSRITQLSIGLRCKKTEELTSLLAYTTNKNSLRICFDLLLVYKDILMDKSNSLKRLDISVVIHSFKQNDINVIAQLFPHLEHLRIETPDLYNIPLLMTSLPHLHTLTFDINYENRSVYLLQERSVFLSQCTDNWMTIWMDQEAYKSSYWRQYSSPSNESIATSLPTTSTSSSSTTNSIPNKKNTINKLFSWLTSFKK